MHDKKRPLKQIFALGHMNQCLERFKKEKLSDLDKQLLQGFYVKDNKELDLDTTVTKQKSKYTSRKSVFKLFDKVFSPT